MRIFEKSTHLMFLKNFTIFVVLFYCGICLSQTVNDLNSTNKFLKIIQKSRDTVIANQLYELSLKQMNDSIRLETYLSLMRFYYKIKDWEKTNYFSHKTLQYSLIQKNNFYKAKAKNYLASLYLAESKYDSAYYYFYNVAKDYKKLGDSLRRGKAFLNMSIIEKNVNDYFTALNTSIEAEKLIRPFKDNRLLGSIYNNLGIISNELGNYEKAIIYHRKALEYRNKLNKPPTSLLAGSINNIAVIYIRKKEFKEAKIYLEKALELKEIKKYKKVYATVIDNLGYVYFLLKNKKKGKLLLSQALEIREQESDVPGKIVSYLHFADVHKSYNIKKAKDFITKAIEQSKTINNQRDMVSAYGQLATLENPTNESLSMFISLKDSLAKEQNTKSNKLGRIKYESDLLKKEKENALQIITLKEEQLKNRNLIIGMLLSIFILTILLFYWIYKVYKTESSLHKEFNHRVRNTLSHLSYYILKLKKQSNNSLFKDSVRELETALETQQLLFSILERNKTSKIVALNQYIQTLISHITRSHPEFELYIDFDMKVKSFISVDKVSNIGLIINEFLTNAFKHGFNKNEKNTIYVSLKIAENKKEHLILLITCSGKHWNPKSIKESSSGLFIMRTLAENMKASIDIYYQEKTILSLLINNKKNN